jgi:hypothetical protein
MRHTGGRCDNGDLSCLVRACEDHLDHPGARRKGILPTAAVCISVRRSLSRCGAADAQSVSPPVWPLRGPGNFSESPIQSRSRPGLGRQNVRRPGVPCRSRDAGRWPLHWTCAAAVAAVTRQSTGGCAGVQLIGSCPHGASAAAGIGCHRHSETRRLALINTSQSPPSIRGLDANPTPWKPGTQAPRQEPCLPCTLAQTFVFFNTVNL